MGNCCGPCFGSSSYSDLTPDVETRRRQQIEAAERRMTEQEQRGIKNIESVRRQQKLAEEREKREEAAGNMGTQPTLKWQMN